MMQKTYPIQIPPSEDYLPQDCNPVPIFEIVTEWAGKTPDKIAIEDGIDRYTYKQLDLATNQIANGLLTVSRKHSQPVGVLLGKDTEAVIAFIGVLKSGKMFTGLDPTNPTSHLMQICNDLELQILLTTQEFLPIAEKIVPPNCEIFLWENWLNKISDDNPDVRVSMDDTAAIIFTSGSTGTPKGVMINHLALWHRSINYVISIKFTQKDRSCCPLHLSYGWASHVIMSILAAGGTAYVYDYSQKTSIEITEWLEENEITVTPIPSSLLKQFLANLSESDGPRLPKLRVINTGGAFLNTQDIALWQTLFPENCYLAYGFASTEAGSITRMFFTADSILNPNEPPKHGPPMHSIELFFVDENRNFLEPGEHGEIVVRSAGNMSGYWRRPDLDRERLTDDPDYPGTKLLFSGDMGYTDENGILIFTGRKDKQVKIRGYLVNLKEVELALDGLPSVLEAAIKTYDRNKGELSLAAYYSLKEGHTLSVQEIKEQLSAKLPPYMVPSYFTKLDKFPHSTSGKIDREQLPPPTNQRPDLSVPYAQPQTEQEQQIADIWHKILDIEPIGVNDNFFDLGGDSLNALEMTLEIEKAFSHPIPQSYFTLPTITNLITILSDTPLSEEAQAPTINFDLKSYKSGKKPSRWLRYYRKLKKLVKKFFQKRDWRNTFDVMVDRFTTRYMVSLSYLEASRWLIKWSHNRFVTDVLYKHRKALYARWLNEIGTDAKLTDELFRQSIMTNLPYDLWRHKKIRLSQESLTTPELEILQQSPSKYWSSLAKLLSTVPQEQVEEYFPLNGIEHLSKVIDSGQSVILLAFHGMTTPIRFMPLKLKLGVDFPTISFRTPLAQTHLDEAKINSNAIRSTMNAELAVYANKILQNGGIIHILGDSNDPAGKDYRITVAGRAYRIKTGFAEMAMHSNAAVVPYFGRILPDGRPEMSIYPAFNNDGGIDGLMQQYETFINNIWVQHPEAVRWNKIFNHFLMPKGD